jgi:hypothetical protein
MKSRRRASGELWAFRSRVRIVSRDKKESGNPARCSQRPGASERPGQAGKSKEPRLDRAGPSPEGTQDLRRLAGSRAGVSMVAFRSSGIDVR